jgi:hypothetical protein
MIAIASILLTISHPGIFFPEISSRYVKQHQHIDEEGTGHGMESIGNVGVNEKTSIDKEVSHSSTSLGHHGHSPSASDEEAILQRER